MIVLGNCTWPKCSDPAVMQGRSSPSQGGHRFSLCEYHRRGGIFGSGPAWDSYEIVEEGFLDILRYVPLETQNLPMYSPRFGDVLLRTGSAIDIFFREWLCLPDYDHNTQVKQLRRRKQLNIGDYQSVFGSRLSAKRVYVRALKRDIKPFANWTLQRSPSWWQAYNKVKHDGYAMKKDATMKNALQALAAWFALHCENRFSAQYLAQFLQWRPHNPNAAASTYFIERIKTPIDAKRYLFRYETEMSTTKKPDT